MRKFKHIKTGWTASNEINTEYCLFRTDNSYAGSIAPVLVEDSKDWEEIVEKDYEILSFIANQNILAIDKNTIISVQPNRKYEGSKVIGNLEDLLENKKWSIHSIKRFSDGEVFTLGEKVKFQGTGCSDVSNISSFKFLEDNLYACSSIAWFNIKYIEKYKSPLFTTEDRVEIFEGDKCFGVTTKYQIIPYGGNKYGVQGNVFFENKWFSTKEKAEEYILLNKPCISLMDLVSINAMSPEQIKTGQIYEPLLKLVKSRL